MKQFVLTNDCPMNILYRTLHLFSEIIDSIISSQRHLKSLSLMISIFTKKSSWISCGKHYLTNINNNPTFFPTVSGINSNQLHLFITTQPEYSKNSSVSTLSGTLRPCPYFCLCFRWCANDMNTYDITTEQIRMNYGSSFLPLQLCLFHIYKPFRWLSGTGVIQLEIDIFTFVPVPYAMTSGHADSDDSSKTWSYKIFWLW